MSHLVVIDMQRVFADPASGWATAGFAAIVPTVPLEPPPRTRSTRTT